MIGKDVLLAATLAVGRGTRVNSHKDLDVWKDAILIAKRVYEITENVPRREEFGLAAQMRKSAV